MENKKKTSVWLIVLGGVLAAYGGYLLNGIWEQGRWKTNSTTGN